jgi:Lhr-like helicase
MENLEDYNHEKEEKRDVYMQLYWKQLRKAGLEIEEYDTTYDLIDDELMDIDDIVEAINDIKGNNGL